jgi:two-component sensor histidine kinase
MDSKSRATGWGRERLFAIGWPATGSTSAWLLAAALVIAAALVKPLLERLGGEPLPPYITFYPVVVLAALGGGPIVGVTAALVTLAIAWLFFQSVPFTFIISGSLLAAVVYACTSIFLGWTVGQARLALDAARAARAQQQYAARESVHRIKNLIAVVQAIVRKVFREVETTADYREVLSARLQGLDIAQQVLVQREWQDAPLYMVIDSALAPFLPNPGLTLRRGPDALIPAACVSGLSMALYELCTNALKYGALAEGRGPVLLSWAMDGGEVVLEWDEKTLTDPRHSESFGSTLIRAAFSGDPAAHVEYRVDPDSVYACFRWRPVPAAAAQGGSSKPVVSQKAQTCCDDVASGVQRDRSWPAKRTGSIRLRQPPELSASTELGNHVRTV